MDLENQDDVDLFLNDINKDNEEVNDLLSMLDGDDGNTNQQNSGGMTFDFSKLEKIEKQSLPTISHETTYVKKSETVEKKETRCYNIIEHAMKRYGRYTGSNLLVLLD